MLKHIYKVSIGAVLMVLGIIGIFVPIMPGFLLILVGYAVIIDKNPKLLIHEVIQKVKEKCRKK